MHPAFWLDDATIICVIAFLGSFLVGIFWALGGGDSVLDNIIGCLVVLGFVGGIPGAIGFGIANHYYAKDLEPTRHALILKAREAEIAACERASMSNPRWATYRTGKHSHTHVFQCADAVGVLHEVVPPTCNLPAVQYLQADEELFRRMTQACGVPLDLK